MNDALGRIERLEEEVRLLKQQATEPMRVTRIELDPGGIQTRLDNQAELLREQEELLSKIYLMVGTQAADIGVLKHDVGTLKTDVSTLRQKTEDGFQAMEKRFDAIAALQRLILERLPEKGE